MKQNLIPKFSLSFSVPALQWSPVKYPAVNLDDVHIPKPILNVAFVEALKKFLRSEQYTTDHERRVAHTYGKSHRDLVRLRSGVVSAIRRIGIGFFFSFLLV